MRADHSRGKERQDGMGRKLRKTVWALGALGIAASMMACDNGDSSTLGGRPSSQGPSTPVDSPSAGGGEGSSSGDPSGQGSSNGVTSTDPGATATSPGSGGVTPGTGPTSGGGNGSNGSDPGAATNTNIDQRQVNYGEALRTASLKLVGE